MFSPDLGPCPITECPRNKPGFKFNCVLLSLAAKGLEVAAVNMENVDFYFEAGVRIAEDNCMKLNEFMSRYASMVDESITSNQSTK